MWLWSFYTRISLSSLPSIPHFCFLNLIMFMFDFRKIMYILQERLEEVIGRWSQTVFWRWMKIPSDIQAPLQVYVWPLSRFQRIVGKWKCKAVPCLASVDCINIIAVYHIFTYVLILNKALYFPDLRFLFSCLSVRKQI